MNLLEKLKLLIFGDPNVDTRDADAADDGEVIIKGYDEPKAANNIADEKPKGNYLENKSNAVMAICKHLYKYAYSNHRNMAVLEIWIVNPGDTNIVGYNDHEFEKDLQTKLAQEQITAVHKINNNAPVSPARIAEMLAADSKIEAVIEGQIYCKLHAIDHADKVTSTAHAREAWLVCVIGEDKVQDKVYHLDPSKKTSWNIGRCEKVSPIIANDIVILPDCNQVSREQARLFVEDGKYFLQRKERGTRTKILRVASQEEEELFTTEPHERKHLNEGDHINLNKQVYYRLTFLNPEND